jgi:nucleoid DNA-binding protein/Asp-tRNA(Asn)/Glu-tRNA(Gln) amidotransferase C subunit
MKTDKLTIADIATYLAQKKGITKKAATTFLQQLTTTFDEALFRDGDLKVKSLGNFSIEWHASRMSVNVQTGEKYEIAGHNKISFIPDKPMREVVNKPFEHLVPVIVDAKSAPGNDTWVEDEELRLDRFSKQAQEILGIIDDLQNIQPKEKAEPTTTPVFSTNEPVNEPEPVQQDASATTQEIEQVSEPVTTAETIATNNIVEEKHEEETLPPSFSEETVIKEQMAKNMPAKNSKWIALSIVLAVIVVISIPIYYYFFIVNHVDNVASPTTTLGSSTPTQPQTLNATPSQPVKPPLTATQVTPKQPEKTDVLTQPRTYKEKLATETFTVGSRLTLMALKYYGNKLFWVYIYEANKDKIANPDIIMAGTRIMIPKLNPGLIDIHNPQCLVQARALQTAYKKQKNIKHTK